jgi:hypothetical protein
VAGARQWRQPPVPTPITRHEKTRGWGAGRVQGLNYHRLCSSLLSHFESTQPPHVPEYSILSSKVSFASPGIGDTNRIRISYKTRCFINTISIAMAGPTGAAKRPPKAQGGGQAQKRPAGKSWRPSDKEYASRPPPNWKPRPGDIQSTDFQSIRRARSTGLANTSPHSGRSSIRSTEAALSPGYRGTARDTEIPIQHKTPGSKAPFCAPGKFGPRRSVWFR